MSGSSPEQLSVSELIDLERSQIGHDLHDLLLPLIFAASANLQSLQLESATELPASDRAKIADSAKWLREALQVGRGLLSQIYPPELEQLSWLAAAKDIVNRLASADEPSTGTEAANVRVQWDVNDDGFSRRMSESRDLAAAAFRILVQAVRNAIQHGSPKSLRILLAADKLEIIDDGCGFDPDAVAADRFGIRSMRGRAALVGKELRVESRPGGPTRVSLIL